MVTPDPAARRTLYDTLELLAGAAARSCVRGRGQRSAYTPPFETIDLV